jgi:3-oxoacyl-[acyl-carrier protein] reductase
VTGASRGITVNNVQPAQSTPIATPPPASWRCRRSPTRLKRHGHVADSAAMVAFVAGPEANYITDASLTADGGTNA